MTFTTLTKTTLAAAIAVASFAPLANAQMGYDAALEADYDAPSAVAVAPTRGTVIAANTPDVSFPQNRGDATFINIANDTDGFFGINIRNLF